MSRFLVILSVTAFIGLTAPAALADAPSDEAPQAHGEDLDLAQYKKKSSSSKGKKSSSSSSRPTPQRSAPRHATTPAQRPAAGQPPAAQRPAPTQQPSAAQRPAPVQQPAARPNPQSGSAQPSQAKPAAQRPTTSPGQQQPGAQARPQGLPNGAAAQPGQIHSQGRVANPTSATNVRPGTQAPAAVHRSVKRSPANNVAGAARHASAQAAGHQGQQAHGNHAQGHQNNQHAAAHNQRVARAHAQARQAQAARHRHHAHANWARRAYHSRHYRNNHSWSWWHRPWRSHYSYGHPWYRPGWSYGVFVYGARPVHHTVYVADQPQTVEEAPTRTIDRAHKWAVGLRGGSYVSGYEHGPGFGDFGLGLSGRYRASDPLGFELAWAHHDQTWTENTERWSEPFAASVQLFAWPWTRFNPYVSAGITWTQRSYRDSYEDRYGTHKVSEDHVLFGPHGGLGLELGLGANASVNVEGRVIGYLNIEEDDRAVPSAVQTTAGVNLYF